jgi:hypothetical protein
MTRSDTPNSLSTWELAEIGNRKVDLVRFW